jgi:hypothetical protein
VGNGVGDGVGDGVGLGVSDGVGLGVGDGVGAAMPVSSSSAAALVEPPGLPLSSLSRSSTPARPLPLS